MTNDPLTAEDVILLIRGSEYATRTKRERRYNQLREQFFSLDGSILEAYAAQEVAKATAWQPIETAPKDETDVDLWVETDGVQYRITNAWYCPDERCWWGPNEFYEAVKLNVKEMKILYWKPVIKPPKEGV